MLISYELWNAIPKPYIVDCKAEKNDILYLMGNIFLLCQTKNNGNNIVIYRKEGRDAREVIRAIYRFCFYLATEHNISYVRFSGKRNKYKFVSRDFPNVTVRQPDKEEGETVYFSKIDDEETVRRLWKLSE